MNRLLCKYHPWYNSLSDLSDLSDLLGRTLASASRMKLDQPIWANYSRRVLRGRFHHSLGALLTEVLGRAAGLTTRGNVGYRPPHRQLPHRLPAQAPRHLLSQLHPPAPAEVPMKPGKKHHFDRVETRTWPHQALVPIHPLETARAVRVRTWGLSQPEAQAREAVTWRFRQTCAGRELVGSCSASAWGFSLHSNPFVRDVPQVGGWVCVYLYGVWHSLFCCEAYESSP